VGRKKGILEAVRSRLGRPFRRNSVERRVLWGLFFFAAFSAIIVLSTAPERYDLDVGEVAPKNIYAPRTVIDRVETERLRSKASEAVPDVYERDPAIAEEAVREARALFAKAREIRDDEALERDARLESLRSLEALRGVPDEALAELLDIEDGVLSEVERSTALVLTTLMQAGISEEALDTFKRQADSEALALDIPATLKPTVGAVVKNLLRPNMVHNEQETVRRRREAMRSVEPVRVVEGEIVVAKGQKLTLRHLALLQDLGLDVGEGTWKTGVGSALLAILLAGVVGAYIFQFEGRVRRSESLIVIVGLISVLVVLLTVAVRPVSGFLAPVAGGAMLLAILVGPRLALVAALVSSVAVGILTGYDFEFLVTALFGGAVSVFSVMRIGQRSDLIRTGVIVAAANALAVVSYQLAVGGASTDLGLLTRVMWAALGGMFSSVLALGSLPFLEGSFGILTPVKLLELSNPNQPLLRRLLMEAPGTYNHSVMVANLAEAATDALGGDSLLSRVGAYYHDVGKLKRPYFFIENQFGEENPHDKISPSLSALILMSHVKDGVETAEEAGLPDRIVDFIREHHGTTLVSYFYSVASEGDRSGRTVAEENFRYDGPVPLSRETAVVMLADSAEAAVRSMTRPTPGRIEGLVRRIIRERLDDHQLDKCDLTFKDLDVIAETFVRILTGVFHPRLEYPEGALKEIEEKDRIASDPDGEDGSAGGEGNAAGGEGPAGGSRGG